MISYFTQGELGLRKTMDSSENVGLFITQGSSKGDISVEIDGNVVYLLDISVSALILYRLLKAALSSASIFFLIEQRFRTPIAASECEKFDKSWISDASHRKWAWVLKVFEEWKKQKNEVVLKEDNSGESIIQEDIDEMSDEMLGFKLVRFVAEVRKEDGQEYPGK